MKDCPDCEDGVVWQSRYGGNDPDVWPTTCENCHGEGEVELTMIDFDGARVQVIATGFEGDCNIFGDRTIIIIDDDDHEIVVASIEEIQLCTTVT